MPATASTPRTPVAALTGFTLLRVLLNAAYRMVYPFLRPLAHAVGAPVEALASVLSLRSLLGVAGPVFTHLAEQRGRRAGMLLGLGLFTAGMALPFLWPTFIGLALGLILGTAGKIAFDPAMQAYLSDRVPYARRGLVLGVAEMAWSLSFIVGVLTLGFVLARWGWRPTFGLLAVLGGLGAASLALALPQHDSHHLPPQGYTWQIVLRHPAAQGVMLLGFAASAANEVVNLVFGLWLQDRFAVTLTGLGGAAAIIGLSELSGEGLVAGLVDRLGKRNAVALGLALNTLAALGMAWADRGTLHHALVALFLFYITFEFTLVSSIPLASGVMPHQRATLLGFFVASLSLGRALGARLAPWLYAHGLALSLLGAALLNAIALLALRDARAAEAPSL